MIANKNRKIIFLHIPKTAGSTFRMFINSLNKQDTFTHYHSSGKGFIPKFHPDYFKHLKNNKNFKPIEIYSGHFVFSEYCINSELFTLIRDIHETFFSNFYFFYFRTYKKQNRNIENFNYIKNQIELDIKLSLDDIPTIKCLLKNNFIISNPFTKVFSGIPFQKYFFVKEDLKVNDESYQLALSNIKYFKGIISNKSIKQFFLNFLKEYDFKVRNFNSQNVANYDRNLINLISNKLFDEILEYNKYDNLLLQEIKKSGSYI